MASERRRGQVPQLGFMTDKFQPDFYITCASVIPVLFLAVAVEGRVYRWALSTSERAEVLPHGRGDAARPRTSSAVG